MATPASCAHCELPVGRFGRQRELSGDTRWFCCHGCSLAWQFGHGERHEPEAAAWLIRLGVAGFLSMNIMLLSLLGYAGGLDGDDAWLRTPVNLLLWLLTTPLVVIVGGPFFSAAWLAARRGGISSDTLVAVGVAAAYGYSAWQVLQGSDLVYFDTLCMVLILFTLGRYLEAQGRVRVLRSLVPMLQAQRAEVRVVEGETETLRPVLQAFASSLDHPGPFARTVEDTAILLRSMAGFDAKDSTSADVPVPDFAAACARGVKGLRIGIPREYRVEGMPEEIERLWQQGIAWLKDAGAEIVDVSLPHTKYGLAAYYVIAPAEASSNLARYDGVRFGLRAGGEDLRDLYERTRAEGFGAEVKRRILIGTYVLSAGYYDAYYLRAQKVRALILRDFTDAFQQVDALLTPTAPSAAFGIGEKTDDPVTMYLNDVFTVNGNLAGIPGISVPAGLNADGLPLGLQVLGKPFDEETVFAVGAALERAAAFTTMPALRAGEGA